VLLFWFFLIQEKKKMTKIGTHCNLDVWKVSIDFVIMLYSITATFPDCEKFGLIPQIRRAGVSICSNIAEGSARNHSRELLQFLYLALGSVSEIETQLEIAVRLGYITSASAELVVLDRIRKMLTGMIKAIKNKIAAEKP